MSQPVALAAEPFVGLRRAVRRTIGRTVALPIRQRTLPKRGLAQERLLLARTETHDHAIELIMLEEGLEGALGARDGARDGAGGAGERNLVRRFPGGLCRGGSRGWRREAIGEGWQVAVGVRQLGLGGPLHLPLHLPRRRRRGGHAEGEAPWRALRRDGPGRGREAPAAAPYRVLRGHVSGSRHSRRLQQHAGSSPCGWSSRGGRLVLRRERRRRMLGRRGRT